ncbi:hypothetical protein [Weissella cibaria]|uniref:Amidohydrolase n=1 Tax=Weissella cibaria TaxID=137591 RepID=A0A0D1JGG4_9LACO|nr:hypothetical protein [Weissella cibaria]KIU20498.1 amidohydrolase [Weissella cibaria]
METVLTRIPVAEQLKWRRWMHQHAEVSFEEFETTAYIENLLSDVPGLTIAKPSPTGLVATLHGVVTQARPLPCVPTSMPYQWTS